MVHLPLVSTDFCAANLFVCGKQHSLKIVAGLILPGGVWYGGPFHFCTGIVWGVLWLKELLLWGIYVINGTFGKRVLRAVPTPWYSPDLWSHLHVFCC
jgi:hypothetical protein